MSQDNIYYRLPEVYIQLEGLLMNFPDQYMHFLGEKWNPLDLGRWDKLFNRVASQADAVTFYESMNAYPYARDFSDSLATRLRDIGCYRRYISSNPPGCSPLFSRGANIGKARVPRGTLGGSALIYVFDQSYQKLQLCHRGAILVDSNAQLGELWERRGGVFIEATPHDLRNSHNKLLHTITTACTNYLDNISGFQLPSLAMDF